MFSIEILSDCFIQKLLLLYPNRCFFQFIELLDYFEMSALPWEEVKPYFATQEDMLYKLEEIDLYPDEESIEYSK